VRSVAETYSGTVVLVGHQPDCGRAVAVLGDGTEPPFPPCGHATLELE
jgi:phosphohistidine phosphatase SixA